MIFKSSGAQKKFKITFHSKENLHLFASLCAKYRRVVKKKIVFPVDIFFFFVIMYRLSSRRLLFQEPFTLVTRFLQDGISRQGTLQANVRRPTTGKVEFFSSIMGQLRRQGCPACGCTMPVSAAYFTLRQRSLPSAFGG